MAIEQLVEQHHIITFQANVELALQRMGPKLRPFVDFQPCQGEQSALIRLFDPVKSQRRTGRKPENVDNRAGRRRRWLLFQDPVESGEYIDELDIWRQAMDPTSDLIRVHTMAVGRDIDEIIVEGLTGEAYEGKLTPTAVPLPSTQKVGIQVGSSPAADTGMNIKKLREARKIFEKNEVDLDREELFVGMSADEHDALFDFVEATSADYQSWDASQRPVFRDGKLMRFMGFNIVRFQGWKTNAAGSIRYCPAWVKRSVKLGVWQDIRARMWNDSSRQNTPVFNIDFVGDCRRTQEGLVVEIACKIPA
jgi:hypothetical protein